VNVGRHRAWGWALLVSLLLHAWSKGETYRWEMLWGCHVATALMAAGFLAGSARAIAVGFLFHVALGFPMWIIECITKWWISPTSILVHTLPLAAGGFDVRRRGLSRHSALLAWSLYVALFPVSAWLAPPELNVNLAHAPWGFFRSYISQLWVFQAGASALTLALLLAWERALGRWLGSADRGPVATSAPD